MSQWRPQLYFLQGRERGHHPDLLARAVAAGRGTIAVHSELPPIFTLRHLAHYTDVEYVFLRGIVARRFDAPYRVFSVRKRNRKEYRRICVPVPELMRVQRWIARRVLRYGRPHEASYAYHDGCKTVDAAALHCRCKWLIKVDVRRFFESLSEISAFRVFGEFGYQPLVCFELARLCTTTEGAVRGAGERWVGRERKTIVDYEKREVGHLPQGAPTSPMLANLAVRSLDERISNIATNRGLVYTRYADDMCLSTSSDQFSRRDAAAVIGEVYGAISTAGLSPNIAKTRVSPPGARKIVLGTNVDMDRPRLTREFRDRLRQHLYYLTQDNCGPSRHAERRGFASLFGMRDHIAGLIAYAGQVDGAFAEECRTQFAKVAWPV
ncbi:MAG TPA: reverse transcriptase family protein [Polyangiaceae bacterium]|jgi:RNA-directed DNA polymerase|nr:reverse transcriptase family protein [Polyangiaceae bacterium]